jgi:polygalacturonase
MNRSIAVLGAALAAVAALPASAKVCDATKYGAKPDGVTKNTKAIQAAIDDCSVSGSGTVKLAGGTFVSGPNVLRSQVTLDLAPTTPASSARSSSAPASSSSTTASA